MITQTMKDICNGYIANISVLFQKKKKIDNHLKNEVKVTKI